MLKQVALDRVQEIKKKSNFLTPYNPKVMELVEKAITNANDIGTLASAVLLLPNRDVTVDQISSAKDPLDSTLFQFEQGAIGWYWSYATYKNPNACVMYYIVRIEIGSKEIREKYSLPIGSTTLYNVSMGLGIGGAWVRNPFTVVRGRYDAFSKTSFRFTGLEMPNNQSFSMETQSLGEFKVDMGFTANGLNQHALTIFSSANRPSFNGQGGCAPCVSGLGTMYWSYTDMTTNTAMIFNSQDQSPLINGDGWLDHQWLRGTTADSYAMRALINLQSATSIGGGLGRYIWINLHLKGVQYMISAFPKSTDKIENGSSFPATYNVYSVGLDNPLWNRKTTVAVVETSTVESVAFPIKVKFTLVDMNGMSHEYVVDTTPYGNTITVDLTNNLHWSGSASCLEDGVETGSAFLEANQFQTVDMYRNTMLSSAGIDVNKSNLWNSGNSFLQALPGLLIMLVWFLSLGCVIVIAGVFFYRRVSSQQFSQIR